MKATDLNQAQAMLRRRDDLLKFLAHTKTAKRVGVSLPSEFDVEVGRPSDSLYVYVEDAAAASGIFEHAQEAARQNLKDIEATLTAWGIEF